MVEKLKDAEDRMLESMFRADAIADDGFSRRILARIRRRIWVRRLALPVATVVGAAIAIKPASQLVGAMSKLLSVVPQGVLEAPTVWVPQLQSGAFGISFISMLVLGAMVLAAAALGFRLLEE